MKDSDREPYITNCIRRAVASGSISKRDKICRELARAIIIAADEGLDVAHSHLISLVRELEAAETEGRPEMYPPNQTPQPVAARR